VFLEDLHSTRNLEATYYVTDTTQASDFYWDRESGLRVNSGILNMHLIPEYRDVPHDGDNKYMLSNPNNSEDKTKFRQIVRNYCRSDAPVFTTDHFSSPSRAIDPACVCVSLCVRTIFFELSNVRPRYFA